MPEESTFSVIPLLAILAPWLSLLIILAIPKRAPVLRKWLCFAGSLVTFGIVISLLPGILDGNTYTIVDEWCEGYMRGVALAAEQWALDTSEMRRLLAPIAAFQGEQALDTHDRMTEKEIRHLQGAIPENVRKIHSHWLSKRTRLRPPTPARSETMHHPAKVGRNDPCPCGSGKKYKKCCLH